MADTKVALVVGVGPGLGTALCRRFAKAGMKVAMGARREAPLKALADELMAAGETAHAYENDAVDESSVAGLFDKVSADLGEPDLVVYNAGAFQRASILEASATDFERCWRVGCFGGFLVGREAARMMVARGSGTIIFTGATASLRGSAQFFNLAVGKFGLRALAQSMARELGPQGVHIAHVIIDGQIASPRHADLIKERGADALLDPNAIADTYYRLHCQSRSAWSQEVDLRPWVERF
ncbi:MAG: SDR family oxidoreductase [Gammaproteobacteria bacterium]|nr:MAG: SDR family oxidoreductase [Gammaproteobacteria bacterium]